MKFTNIHMTYLLIVNTTHYQHCIVYNTEGAKIWNKTTQNALLTKVYKLINKEANWIMVSQSRAQSLLDGYSTSRLPFIKNFSPYMFRYWMM